MLKCKFPEIRSKICQPPIRLKLRLAKRPQPSSERHSEYHNTVHTGIPCPIANCALLHLALLLVLWNFCFGLEYETYQLSFTAFTNIAPQNDFGQIRHCAKAAIVACFSMTLQHEYLQLSM